MKRQGLYERALIVVTSDHGEEFLDHGRWKHGRDLYQTLIHVPLIVRFPGGARGGTRIGGNVSLLDLFPTLLESAGIEAPSALHGASLLPLLDGTVESRTVIAHESRLGRELVAVVEGRHKLIREISPRSRIRLFDLESDAGEQHDIAGDDPARVEALARIARRQVAAAHEGYSVRFFGDGQPHHVTGRLSTTGRFVELEGYQLRDGDTVAAGDDDRGLAFELSLAENETFSLRGMARVYDNVFVDERGFRFRVEPADANVEWTFELDGTPFPSEHTLLGPDDARPDGMPFALTGDDPRLLRPDAILPLNTAYVRASPVHARIWRNQPAADEEARISPEIEKRLEALGYVE